MTPTLISSAYLYSYNREILRYLENLIKPQHQMFFEESRERNISWKGKISLSTANAGLCPYSFFGLLPHICKCVSTKAFSLRAQQI
jgi:hypothetical protein